jgi:hypothetical protein
MDNVIDFGPKALEMLIEEEKEAAGKKAEAFCRGLEAEGWEIERATMFSTDVCTYATLVLCFLDGVGRILLVDHSGNPTLIAGDNDLKKAEWMFEALLYQAKRTFYDGLEDGMEETLTLYGDDGPRSYENVKKMERGFRVCR